MANAGTESVNRNASGLDLLAPSAILGVLAEAQIEAAQVVRSATQSIAAAAELAAGRLAAGGRLVYAAAGSSGLMALADALELPGTYGIALDRIVVLIAGGKQALIDLAGGPEDDAAQAAAEIAAANVSEKDCVIALSASGTTPYALGALDEAKRRGAATIGIANNPGAPLAARADVGIVLATPPEVIAGSTRMGAGTAQKIALNMFSTLVAIHLGHVHDGYMVNLKADNIKLRGRAARIVAAITGCTPEEASGYLEQAGGSVKVATVLAAGARDASAAHDILAGTGNRLRPALASLEEGSTRSRHNGT
jgi:N-acetylmuramic acid 6-phosphate etherase